MRVEQNKIKTTSRLPEFLGDGFVVFAVTLFLLWIPSGSYLDVTGSKFRLFSIACAAYVVLTCAAWLLFSKERPKLTAFSCLLALYVLFTGLSAVFSPYQGTLLGNSRKDGFVTVALYALCAWLLHQTYRPKKWILPLLGAVACVYCGIGILQLLGKNPFGLYPADCNYYDKYIRYGGEFLTTTGNADFCASVLSMLFGTFFAGIVCVKERRGVLLALPLLFTAFLLAAMKVEAGLVALGAGVFILPPVLVRSRHGLARALLALGTVALAFAAAGALRFYDGGVTLCGGLRVYACLGATAVFAAVGVILYRRPERRSRYGLALAGVACLLFAAGLAFVYFRGAQSGALYEAHEILHGRAQDSFGSGRLGIWKNVLEKVKERPLLGGGPDTLGQRKLPLFSRYDENLGRTIFSAVDTAHNEYLNILVNQGLFALLSFAGVLLVSLLWWCKRKKDPAAAIAGAGMLLYCVTAFFSISMCFTTLYLFVALAIINRKSSTP
ncbi:MAG: O-antigen ligase family protein [Clostridia bacterium]|nr:O-antigen ligase family protein [Clostridia bacterium]